MTYMMIITLCLLVLVAYIFDLSSSRTRVPSIVLLLAFGLVLRLASDFLGLQLPDLRRIIPVLGTVGLLLIVLEGALEIELTRDKFPIIKSGIASAATAIAVFFVFWTLLAYYALGMPFRDCALNVVPLSIISSAVAIPTAQALSPEKREFVVYESSLSDILGIMLFNYFLSFEGYFSSILSLTMGTVRILLISFVSSITLSLLMRNITHHVKFVPIIAFLILIYSFAKIAHLPALILILVFGLFLNNAGPLLKRYGLGESTLLIKEADLGVFKHLVNESTFLVKSFFFIMIGFYAETASFLDPETLLLSFGIVIFVLGSRAFVLKALKVGLNPLLYIAPRGLITILLFLNIPAESRLPFLNEGLMTEVIFLSALIMTFGMVRYRHRAA